MSTLALILIPAAIFVAVVAGVAALYKQRFGDQPSATVHNWLNSGATPNVVSGGATGGTVNRLLFTNGL